MKCFITVIICLLAMTAAPAFAAPVKVFVSILPQKYFVERIGGDRVDVSVMVDPAADPHTFEPKPRRLVELSRADIFFAIGVSFEDVWLDRIAAANPKMRIVHTDQGIEKIPMVGGHGDSEHDAEDHGIPDPHVWTSPVRVRIIAENIYRALVSVDPDHESDYRKGRRDFMAELDALDAELRGIFKGREGSKFIVFHPSWGYLAHDYGLVQVPVEIEGKRPKPAQLRDLILRARAEGVKVVFIQPQTSKRDALLIAREIGGEVVEADPLAEDWAGNLRRQAEKFKAALR